MLKEYSENNMENNTENTNQKKALDCAVSAIYFEDSSDYLTSLYGVVKY